jgi:hypothetical protein
MGKGWKGELSGAWHYTARGATPETRREDRFSRALVDAAGGQPTLLGLVTKREWREALEQDNLAGLIDTVKRKYARSLLRAKERRRANTTRSAG